MALDDYQIGYFITQVGLAAASLGVAASDINDVANALFSLFSYKCSPPVKVDPLYGKVLDSICVDVSCPAAPDAMCGLYDNMHGTSPSPSTASSCLSNSMTSTLASSCPYEKTMAYTKTETKAMTVTVTKQPKQTQCWCHNYWQEGARREWCNE